MGSDLTQAGVVAWLRHCDMFDMVVEAEIFVFYPIGSIQAQWHRVKFPAKLRYEGDSLHTVLTKLLVIETGAVAAIKDDQQGHVLVDVACLTSDKHNIFPAKWFD
jgi:hypothetical protein